MAASRIKGITVEINGDTTGLNKALESVNKNIKSTVSGIYNTVKDGFKQQEKIVVDYFDTETLEIVSTEMYIDGYKAVRALDVQWTSV